MPHRDGLSRCEGCGCPYDDCPISDDDAEWTTDANGNHDGLCCEDCWHPNDNAE